VREGRLQLPFLLGAPSCWLANYREEDRRNLRDRGGSIRRYSGTRSVTSGPDAGSLSFRALPARWQLDLYSGRWRNIRVDICICWYMVLALVRRG